jgi:hypothetical protein
MRSQNFTYLSKGGWVPMSVVYMMVVLEVFPVESAVLACPKPTPPRET